MHTMAYVKQGRSNPSEWKNYPDDVQEDGQKRALKGIFIDIDTSAAKFKGVPQYITSLEGKSGLWEVAGINAIYNPSATRFRVYLKFADPAKKQDPTDELSREYAQRHEWVIRWTGIELRDEKKEREV